MWFSSVRALLSILAAASLLEKRGGNVGRGRGLLLKNKGEGGWLLTPKEGGPNE
jgi:hypothetical protein